MEIARGITCKFFETLAAQVGEEPRRVADEARFARLAAMRDWRKERTVCFDQQTVARDLPRKFLQISGTLEGYDPRDRDREAQIENGPPEVG